jgi:DNA-binding transcriptional LysR family regulator
MSKYDSLFVEDGLSLERLRTLCLVDDAGSLSKAADRQPSRLGLYSRQLKELEKFFGAPLTRRVGQVLQLTDAGQKLAALARGKLEELATFRQTCKELPHDIAIGAPNSIVAWVLMPRLGELRQAIGGAHLTVWTMRMDEIISRIESNQLNVGIVRRGAAFHGLSSCPLFTVRYALFVPETLAKGMTADNLKNRLKDMPLATSMGGRFRLDLENAATKAKWTLNIVLSCSSFTHAAQALASGTVAAVLPALMQQELLPGNCSVFSLPFLRGYEQKMRLVWRTEGIGLTALGRLLRHG